MEFSRSQQVNRIEASSYMPDNQDKTLFVNILIIDNSNSQSIAYQYSNDAGCTEDELTAYAAEKNTLRDSRLIGLGKVLSIKKQSRFVILEEGTTIEYRHLIVAGKTSDPHRDGEFLAALTSLISAMRLQQKIEIPIEFLPNQALPAQGRRRPNVTTESTEKREKTFAIQTGKALIGKLLKQQDNPSSRLYELQI